MIDDKLKYCLGLMRILYRRSKRRERIGNFFLFMLYLILNLTICILMPANSSIALYTLYLALLTFLNALILSILIVQDHMFQVVINIQHFVHYPVSTRWYYNYVLLSHLKSKKFVISIVPLLFLPFKTMHFSYAVVLIACILYLLFVVFVTQTVSSFNIVFYKHFGKIAHFIFYTVLILFPIQSRIAGDSEDISDYIIFNAPVIGWVGKGVESAIKGDLSRSIHYIVFMIATCILLYFIIPRVLNKMEL